MANRSIEIKAHYKDTKATIALTIVKYLPRLCEYLKKKKKKKKKKLTFELVMESAQVKWRPGLIFYPTVSGQNELLLLEEH